MVKLNGRLYGAAKMNEKVTGSPLLVSQVELAHIGKGKIRFALRFHIVS